METDREKGEGGSSAMETDKEKVQGDSTAIIISSASINGVPSKDTELRNENAAAIIIHPLSVTIVEEVVQHAMLQTMKMFEGEGEANTQHSNTHFQRPLELCKMDAIQTLIEQEKKKKKKGRNANKRAGAVVGLDA